MERGKKQAAMTPKKKSAAGGRVKPQSPPPKHSPDPVHPRRLSTDEGLTTDERLKLLAAEVAEFRAGVAELLEAVNKDSRKSEADHDRLAGLETWAAEFKAEVAEFRAGTAELLEAVNKDRRNNEGHRRNLSQALEDEFVASLPRVMKEAHGIVIQPEDILTDEESHSGKGGVGTEGEVDFIAPNGELVLAGEVKNRLRKRDVEYLALKLRGGRDSEFRRMFPQYAGLPVHGVVAGALIDPKAKARALMLGFIVMRLDGAGAHPATARGKFRPTAY